MTDILKDTTNPARDFIFGSWTNIGRVAALKTGTTDNLKDVYSVGYVPTMVTGVWMGNSNQEPLSNKLGQGLYSADGPLYLWHEFMKIAINGSWDWNGQAPVPNNDFAQPPGVVRASVCRFSGMSPTGACGKTIEVPFLDGTVPPRDNVHVNKRGSAGFATPDASGNGGGIQVSGSCFDVVAEVDQDGRRPPEMVAAARRWADRFVNGQLGPRGDPNKIGILGPDRVWLLIAPLRGNNGFGAPICGQIRATPTPVPTPRGSGGDGCKGKPGDCTPVPSPAAGGIPLQPPTLVGFFAVPAILSTVPLAARVIRWTRRRRRRR